MIVPRYESALHAMLVATYAMCAAQAALGGVQFSVEHDAMSTYNQDCIIDSVVWNQLSFHHDEVPFGTGPTSVVPEVCPPFLSSANS